MTQPAFLTDPALGHVWDVLPEARVVGGAVRDALAGRAVVDIDLATPRAPSCVMVALKRSGVKVVPIVTVAGSTVPVPDKVPPAFTVTALELAIAPSTSRLPRPRASRSR